MVVYKFCMTNGVYECVYVMRLHHLLVCACALFVSIGYAVLISKVSLRGVPLYVRGKETTGLMHANLLECMVPELIGYIHEQQW